MAMDWVFFDKNYDRTAENAEQDKTSYMSRLTSLSAKQIYGCEWQNTG